MNLEAKSFATKAIEGLQTGRDDIIALSAL